MGKQKPIKETLNKAITRYFTKEGKEITEEDYKKLQNSGVRRQKTEEKNPPSHKAAAEKGEEG